MEFIDLKAQYSHLKNKIDDRIQRVLDHGQFIMGPEVAELEQKLTDYLGVEHAISCANGTDALQLALMAMEIGQGDAVFCPTFTFFASAEAISFVGATPVFIDSEETTFNICPEDLKLKIKQTIDDGRLNPKAIMTVDLFGLPANYPAILPIAKEYNLKIIEDAAQGFGGSINGKKAGSFGDISTTSFFPAKPLGCYGDGGAIFTDNDEYADLIRSYRIHGKGTDKYDNVRIGMNSRLDTIQAAILLEKLAAFPAELNARQDLANAYSAALKGHNDIITPTVSDGYLSSWAQYTIRSDHRDEFIAKLKEAGVPSVVYYEKCMHQQSAFKEEKYGDGFAPTAEKLSKTVLSIPMHPYMDTLTSSKIAQLIHS